MAQPADRRVADVLAWLERRGTAKNRAGMARFGIPSARAFGLSMATMRPMVTRLGRDHALAVALWRTGWHEARILAGFVDQPAAVTRAQMDRWCAAFDNWAVCDSTCLHLFSRTAEAWPRALAWADDDREFVRRAGFAMLASLALTRSKAEDGAFTPAFRAIEVHAGDGRNFVKKAVNWALRQIGKRNPALNRRAVVVARRLASSAVPSARWIGKDALRELTAPATRARLATRAAAAASGQSASR